MFRRTHLTVWRGTSLISSYAKGSLVLVNLIVGTVFIVKGVSVKIDVMFDKLIN